jgi:hypothetical protein
MVEAFFQARVAAHLVGHQHPLGAELDGVHRVLDLVRDAGRDDAEQ